MSDQTPESNFLQFDTPTFTHEDVDQSLKRGAIDINDARFLKNVLDEYVASPTILKEVALYRIRLNKDLQPGRDLFVKMQELGCVNHPLTSLDISGYNLPAINLNGAIIGENLKMRYSKINGNLLMKDTRIKGDVLQKGMQVGGSVYQKGAEVGGSVDQRGTKVGGDVDQTDAQIGGNVDQKGAEIGGDVDQRGTKVGGSVYQEEAKIADRTFS